MTLPPWRSSPAFTWERQRLKCWCHMVLGWPLELILANLQQHLSWQAEYTAITVPPAWAGGMPDVT